MNESFTLLQWGDPMLAQMSSSDAQAYGSDPAAATITSMLTGPEQVPGSSTALASAANGSTYWDAVAAGLCKSLPPPLNLPYCGPTGSGTAQAVAPAATTLNNTFGDPSKIVQSAVTNFGLILLAIVIIGIGLWALAGRPVPVPA